MMQARLLRALATCTFLAAATSSRSAGAQIVRQSIEHSDNLDYLLYLPNGHDPSKKWPLILFLHGFGERSSLNRPGEALSALPAHSMPVVVESADWDWPFIVVSPQIDDEGWITRASDLGALIDRMLAEHGADPARLYLTGLSYGGRGTWEVGLAQLDRWAALMPLCSDPTGLEADARAQLAEKPLFVVHGTLDPTGNDFATVEQFIASFESEGTPFYQFEYSLRDQEQDLFPPEVLTERHVFARMMQYGHDVWTATYGRRDAAPKTVSFTWLLAQSLDGYEFIDPRDPSYESVIAARQPEASETNAGCALSPGQERPRGQSSDTGWAGLIGLLAWLGWRQRPSRRDPIKPR